MATINQHYAYEAGMGWDDTMFGYEPEPMDWSEDGLYAWLDEMADVQEFGLTDLDCVEWG